MKDKKPEKDNRWKERAKLVIYSMMGVYLLYLSYCMFQKISLTSGGEQRLIIVFTILFAVIGFTLILFGLTESYKRKKRMWEMDKTEKNMDL